MDEGRPIFPAVGKTIQSGFDAEFYLLTKPDVGFAGTNPYEHFKTYDWIEGRNPNAFFDASWHQSSILSNQPINPLDHYIDTARLNRPSLKTDIHIQGDPTVANEVFPTDKYMAYNPDVTYAGVNPLDHFLTFGIYEHRSPIGEPYLFDWG